jgi:hypothetical protein
VISTENDAADEAEHKRANSFADGLSLCFFEEEHHNDSLSKSGDKPVGMKLLEM